MKRLGLAFALAFGMGAACGAQMVPGMRSGQVLICHLDKGCSEETVDGQKVFVMEADGFTVRASIGYDQDLSRAEISIRNSSTAPVMVRAADFRMEATEPKLVRLSYVDQEKGPALKTKAVKETSSHGLPDPSYWGSAKQKKAMQEQTVVRTPSAGLLRSGNLAAGATTAGLVYFELPRRATSVSLVLPISGALFEFPCEPPPAAVKGRKLRKIGA